MGFLAVTAFAQGNLGPAGRVLYQGVVTNQVTLDLSKLSAPARLATLSVQYSGVASGTVMVVSQLAGNHYLQMSNTIVNARSWVLTATDIWFRPDQGDKLILQTTCTNYCTAVADFAR